MERKAESFLLCFPGSSSNREDWVPPLDSLCEDAAPGLQGVGGLHHSLLVLPHAHSPEEEAHVRTLLGEGVSMIADPKEPAYLCCETRNLPFAAVYDVIGERREDLRKSQRGSTPARILIGKGHSTKSPQETPEGILTATGKDFEVSRVTG
jgi:hypothetical protein